MTEVLSNPRSVDREHKATNCMHCGGRPPETVVANHSLLWHDGDVVCAMPDCGRFVRDYDAG